jgi:RND family efflux transporter MFP subunit
MKKIVSRSTLALLLLTVMAMPFSACKKKDQQQVPTSSVTKGTFYIDLFEEGEVEAVQSTIITVPIISYRFLMTGAFKISQIVKDGTEVQAGDTLIMFDPADIEKIISDLETNLEVGLAELDKLVAQQQSETEEMLVSLEVARISHEISQIRAAQAQYESEMTKREMKITLEKADISLAEQERRVENTKLIQEEDLRQKQNALQTARDRIAEGNEALDKLVVTSPTPGLVILMRNSSTDNKFEVGDQIWMGAPMIELPDLSKLKATVKINEVDIAKVRKGLEVEIRPDAFSETVLKGTVSSVANLAVDKDRNNKSKVFPVEILIDETNENLAPGMTVSCRLLVEKIEDVLSIPLEALQTDGITEFVYRKHGNSYDRVDVETGMRNNDHVIITKGLSEKDDVALVDPFATVDSEQKTAEGQE